MHGRYNASSDKGIKKGLKKNGSRLKNDKSICQSSFLGKLVLKIDFFDLLYSTSTSFLSSTFLLLKRRVWNTEGGFSDFRREVKIFRSLKILYPTQRASKDIVMCKNQSAFFIRFFYFVHSFPTLGMSLFSRIFLEQYRRRRIWCAYISRNVRIVGRDRKENEKLRYKEQRILLLSWLNL